MHRIDCWIIGCVGLFAVPAWADGGAFKVDEDKLPEWVKRLSASPYQVIRNSSTIHIRAPGRAASGVAPAGAAAVASGVASKKAGPSNATSSVATTATLPAPLPTTPALSLITLTAGNSGAPSAESATRDVEHNAAPGRTAPMPASDTIDGPRTAAADARGPGPVVVGAVQTAPRSIEAQARAPTIEVLCPVQAAPTMPRAAAEQNIGGTVRTRALVQDGVVKYVTIVNGPQIFHPAVRAAMKAYQCQHGDTAVWVTQDFVFEPE